MQIHAFTVEDEAQTFQLCRPITEESSTLWLHLKSHTLIGENSNSTIHNYSK